MPLSGLHNRHATCTCTIGFESRFIDSYKQLSYLLVLATILLKEELVMCLCCKDVLVLQGFCHIVPFHY